MNITKSKYLFPISALIIWIIIIALFGLLSHFSAAGFSLLVYAVCILVYDSVKGRNSGAFVKQMITAIIGLIVSCMNVANAFYLENQGLLFKWFVALFSLSIVYVFLKMIKQSDRRYHN